MSNSAQLKFGFISRSHIPRNSIVLRLRSQLEKKNSPLTQEQRISIVRYRIESAENTLAEVATHRANGFYNTAVNRL